MNSPLTLRTCTGCQHSRITFLFPPSRDTLARIACGHPLWRDGGHALLAIVPAGQALDAITVKACPLDTPAQTVGELLADVAREAAVWSSQEFGSAPPPAPPVQGGSNDDDDHGDDWKKT